MSEREKRAGRPADADEGAGPPDVGPPGAEAAGRGERLQKYLARAGVASRRRAEELMAAGEVSVNGAVAREPGMRVDPARDEVRVRGRVVRPAADHRYILLNKPVNTVSTTSDPEGRRTVLDLLPPDLRAARLYPVGRLDYDTEGLLLLTDDGDLALRLTHPRYALPKVYHALVEGRPTAETAARLERGLSLPGEERPTAPARVWRLRPAPEGAWVGIEIHEGRNRQVRRMFEAVGHPVLMLRRVRVGPLTLGGRPPNGLAPGASRPLTEAELAKLRAAVGLGAGPPASPEGDDGSSPT